MKMVGLVLLGLALAGCESDQEEDVRVSQSLPPGCLVKDLGEYRSLRNLVVVHCNKAEAETSNFGRQVGKVYQGGAVVTFGDEASRK